MMIHETMWPENEGRISVGRFRLDDHKGPLNVSNIARRSARTAINNAADLGYALRWERDGDYAEVYYNLNEKPR